MRTSADPFRYVWRVHQNYLDSDFSAAIEVRPRFGQIDRWRIAIPSVASVVSWGIGPSGGTTELNKPPDVCSGSGGINGVPVTWLGASAKLSPWISAYMVLSGGLPDFVAIGVTSELHGQVGELEIYSFTALREWAMVVET